MSGASDALNQLPRYVRVLGVRNQRFVEFAFAIGDPNLFVELILPFEQFHHFCQQNQVQELTPEQAAQVELDSLKWRYGQVDASVLVDA